MIGTTINHRIKWSTLFSDKPIYTVSRDNVNDQSSKTRWRPLQEARALNFPCPQNEPRQEHITCRTFGIHRRRRHLASAFLMLSKVWNCIICGAHCLMIRFFQCQIVSTCSLCPGRWCRIGSFGSNLLQSKHEALPPFLGMMDQHGSWISSQATWRALTCNVARPMTGWPGKVGRICESLVWSCLIWQYLANGMESDRILMNYKFATSCGALYYRELVSLFVHDIWQILRTLYSFTQSCIKWVS